MSLINDALKRAKKSQQLDASSGAPPLPPVEPEKPRDGSGWLFLGILVLLIAAAGFLIGLAFTKRKAAPEVVATAPVTQNIQVTQAVAVVSTPAPPPAPQTNVVIAPKPPEAPALKLQGIFYNGPRPQAIVNGTTVYVGDIVNGFHVKLIAQNYVSFTTPDGTEKTLTLSK